MQAQVVQCHQHDSTFEFAPYLLSWALFIFVDGMYGRHSQTSVRRCRDPENPKDLKDVLHQDGGYARVLLKTEAERHQTVKAKRLEDLPRVAGGK